MSAAALARFFSSLDPAGRAHWSDVVPLVIEGDELLEGRLVVAGFFPEASPGKVIAKGGGERVEVGAVVVDARLTKPARRQKT